jgi:hypothetical protein
VLGREAREVKLFAEWHRREKDFDRRRFVQHGNGQLNPFSVDHLKFGRWSASRHCDARDLVCCDFDFPSAFARKKFEAICWPAHIANPQRERLSGFADIQCATEHGHSTDFD